MDSPALQAEKDGLRRRQRLLRKQAAAATPWLPEQAAGLLQSKLLPRDCLAGYAAIHSEPDVLPLMAVLQRSLGLSLALPLVPGPAQPLRFLRYQPGDALIAGAFGARTPGADKPEVRPSVLLVPLLAFDAARFRLGYGGGYYDRSIGHFAPRLTIGIAYAAQRVAGVPVGGYDRQLDFILTEEGLL